MNTYNRSYAFNHVLNMVKHYYWQEVKGDVNLDTHKFELIIIFSWLSTKRETFSSHMLRTHEK